MKINPVRNFSGAVRSSREFSQTTTCVAKQQGIISNGIKLIILDFHGVFLLGSMRELCDWLAEICNKNREKTYNLVYKKYFNIAAEGKMTESEFFRKIAKMYPKAGNWEKLRMYHLNAQRINKKVFSLAKDLQTKGYEILLLSKNTRPQFLYYLKKFKLRKYFKNIINTVDLNLPKASKRTMLYIMKRFKIKNPEKILYIDDQKDNLAAPRKMGVKVILYKDFRRMKKEMKNYL